jgi:hypothetical protein
MGNDQRIGWDYEFSEEDTKGGEATILPDGDYDATVEDFERGQFAGNENLQAGPMAVLTLAVNGGELGISRPRVNLILNQKLAWKIDQLAVSCGFWKRGEGKGRKMPWGELKGARLRVKVASRKYQDKPYQEVVRFLAPTETRGAEQIRGAEPANQDREPANQDRASEGDGYAIPDEV